MALYPVHSIRYNQRERPVGSSNNQPRPTLVEDVPAKKSRYLTNKEVMTAIAMVNQGYSMKAIAYEMKRSLFAIRQHLQRNNIHQKRGRPRKYNDSFRKAVASHRINSTSAETARAFKISIDSVRRFYAEYRLCLT